MTHPEKLSLRQPSFQGGWLRRCARPLWLALLVVLTVGVFAPSSVSAEGLAPKLSTNPGPENTLGKESDSDLWRRVRQGQSFTLNPQLGAKVLVQSEGEIWRLLHNDTVKRYGGYLILAMIAATAAFWLIRGRVRIEGGRSGRTIPRFTQAERTIHWFVASVFVMLGLSGLVLLFGRIVLVPIIGKNANSILASAMLQGHNLLGPLFIFGILAMAVVYVKDNLPRAADFAWFFKGGPFFKWHVPSWKYNAGEKIWFWIAVVGGLALSGSGILMEFPWLAQTLLQIQLANLIHGIAAAVVIALAVAHIYLGTIGVEGALEGMTKGRVDAKWAQEHHYLWADEVSGKQSGTGETAPAE